MLDSIITLRQWSSWLDSTCTAANGKTAPVFDESKTDEWGSCGKCIRNQCHEIEREIERRYFELPTDADKIPIRVGDGMVNVKSKNNGDVETFLRVIGVGSETFVAYMEDEGGYRSQNAHVYQASDYVHCPIAEVRDILEQLVDEAKEYELSGEPVHEVVARYARKLRLKNEHGALENR